jgi:heptaprenyl diphosphate synthase
MIRTLSKNAFLLALMLVLGYLEQLLVVLPGLPGVKLGLANTVLLYALYLSTPQTAALLLLAKVLLSGLLFAGFTGFAYSLVGGALALGAMFLLYKRKSFGVVGVSVFGALFHNLGQSAVAGILLGWNLTVIYLPILLASAIITGMLTGLLARAILPKLKRRGA